MSNQETNRWAVITGSSRGFGRALASRCADDGWNVVVVARDEVAVATAVNEIGSDRARGVAADITTVGGRERLRSLVAELGPVDLLVNNAGALGPSPLPALLDLDGESFRSVLQTNVVAQLQVIQALEPHLSTDVTIVNISSDAAVAAYPGWGAYGVSKAALDHLSRVLAVERPAWRVLSVDPGDMRTDMHQAAFPGEDISDRPEPSASTPGLARLVDGDFPSGRYMARAAHKEAS